ncbi:mucin-2-like [Paramacrobiotus metropolitanus]|uniref:mucin-2-like n=1 Tax=Paramacrobiotus metropolitanus TaxID=2943436 RepID=UPI00244592C2|nr:mucin-2-like [Paramacrobiotus metropolitanus]
MTAQYSLPQQLTYNLAGTNAFTIDNSGRLTNTVPLDGAVVPSYTFTVIASDSRNTASSATAVVVINVQPCIASTTPTTTAITTPPVAPPSFQLAQYFANISCLTTPGFLIGTITAQYSRPLTYSLVNTNAFTVDNFGQVTNTGPVNGAVVPTYFFSIVARDTANPAISATAQVVISVGSCVAPVATTQPTLPPTVPTAPTPPPFVFTTPPFIFTTPPFVFPTPGPTTSAPFLPTPPRFSQQQYVFNIACQNNPGFPVGAVSVQYQQPQQLTLTLTNTNDFRIDNSGQITANVPMNGAQRPVHNFNAVAQDSFNPSLSATAQIVVNVAACSFTTQPTFPPTLPPTTPAPLPPQFPQGQYVFNVQCLSNIGSPIGTTIAQYSQPQQLVYNLINTNSFAINNGGQISNTVLLNGAIQPSNTFTVVAADSRNPVLSGTAQIIVNVAACITPGTPAPVTFPPTLPPTQPPRPVFPQAQYTANVSCLTSVGFLVGTITAQYPQQLVYTLQNTNTFNVDNFGQIRNVIPLNGAQLPSSTFFIVAADPSNPSNSASAQITVFVGVCPTPPPTTSVAVFTPPVTFPTPPPVFTFPTPPTTPRPTPPQFSQSQYTASVACQSQPGFPIGTVTAQYSQPNQLSYTLSGTNSFSVNNAGQITNTVPLDGAFIPTHTFTITAIDARNPLLSASAQILVTVAACTTTTSDSHSDYAPTAPSCILAKCVLRDCGVFEQSWQYCRKCAGNRPVRSAGSLSANWNPIRIRCRHFERKYCRYPSTNKLRIPHDNRSGDRSESISDCLGHSPDRHQRTLYIAHSGSLHQPDNLCNHTNADYHHNTTGYSSSSAAFHTGTVLLHVRMRFQ